MADIPDIGPPFDLEADDSVELAEEDNTPADYRMAGTLVRGLSEADEDAFDATQEHEWSKATDSLKAWLGSNRAALDAWGGGTENTNVRGRRRLSGFLRRRSIIERPAGCRTI